MIVDSNDKTFIELMLEYARSLKTKKDLKNGNSIPESVIKEIELSMQEMDNEPDSGISHDELLRKLQKDFPGLTI